jgi:hypothetical protein
VNGIGSSGSIKGGKFLDEVSHYKLLNDCAVSSLGISRQATRCLLVTARELW